MPKAPGVDASDTGMPGDSKRLALGIFFAIAGTNLLTPLLPSITEEFGISFAAAGLLVSSYILARLSSSLVVGPLVTRLGSIRVAWIAYGLLEIGAVIGFFSPTAEVLLASRLISGVGVGFIATLALTSLADLAPSSSRGRVMSLFQISHNAGIAVYPILGGLIGLLAGWRATYVVVAVGAVISAGFLMAVLRRVDPTVEAGPKQEATPPPITRRRRTLGIGATLVGVFAVMFNRHGMRNTLLPLYAGTVLGLGPVAIATGITAMSIVGLVIAMPGAMAGDRLGHRPVIVAGLLLLAAGDVAFLLTGDYTTFLVASIALGFGDFFIGSQTALLASLAPSGQRSQVLSGFRLATDAGALMGPIALGVLMDALGPQTAMVTAALILALVAVFSRYWVPNADWSPSSATSA